MDALVAFGDRCLDSQESRPFGGPVARGAGAVFFSGDHDERNTFFLILHRRVVNEHLLLVRQVRGPTALGAGRKPVLEPHVGKRPAHHHLMVAAPGAVLVEVFGLDAMLREITGRRAVPLDRADRRNMVGCDRVSQQRQDPGAVDVLRRRGRLSHIFEIWRLAHVS